MSVLFARLRVLFIARAIAFFCNIRQTILLYTPSRTPKKEGRVMSVVAIGGIHYALAWQEICEHVSRQDLLELGDIDDADLVGAIIGLLVAEGYESDDAEQLLVRAGLLERAG